MDSSPSLKINEREYLEMPGLNVMLAHDYYPEGRQGGISIVQNGVRVATNGDLRLEPTPGQWSPIPKVGEREVDRERNEIGVRMSYPDDSRNGKGFNPIEYPDLHLSYRLRIRPEGKAFRIIVDLDEALPRDWVGKVGFNLELFPGHLFGRSFSEDGGGKGIFPRQPNGPSLPLSTAWEIVIAPESDRHRMGIKRVKGGGLWLIDGRSQHNAGWFIVRALIEAGVTEGAIEWLVTPHAIPNWKSEPVVQVSQVGYHPDQPKMAVFELDKCDVDRPAAAVLRILADGQLKSVLYREPEEWGEFLRFRYLRLDFTEVKEPGMYIVRYGRHQSSPFRIDTDVYERGVWQPTLEYFLPVQMCHMRVNENQRVWHGACHLDDARMASVDHLHHDGYEQGGSTLCSFQSGEHVPGLDRGGWHDAGDYDLRVESQAQTVHGLALAYEEFGLDYDNTTVDQEAQVVELLRPDGKPDVLQQIEHGLLSIVGGYRALGRLYRGIIEVELRQYQHLGDAATVTDNRVDPEGIGDDRWVFTEQNPARELDTAAALAAASRVLPGYNDEFAAECLSIARELYDQAQEKDPLQRVNAAVELLITTREDRFARFLIQNAEAICSKPARYGWMAARSLDAIKNPSYRRRVKDSLSEYRKAIDESSAATPYRIPYVPHIWGAGWSIQRVAMEEYWMHKALPDVIPPDCVLDALNFVLGCHPGPNTASFVSGVGAKSVIPAYGVNRADESYIPGGVVSGTALIRPDLPELLEWPHLWQQTEYCVGYPTVDYIFLVAAANHLLNGRPKGT